jgi:hypothetical protein
LLGLGAASTADRITIEWPSGRRQVVRNVTGDRLVEITEPA